jgi:hypothetical protein
MNPPQKTRERHQNLNPDNPTGGAWASGRNNLTTPQGSQPNKKLPQLKHTIYGSQFRPQIISEDLYWHVIEKYPLEGLILTKLIEQGEYQISSSGYRNSHE